MWLVGGALAFPASEPTDCSVQLIVDEGELFHWWLMDCPSAGTAEVEPWVTAWWAANARDSSASWVLLLDSSALDRPFPQGTVDAAAPPGAGWTQTEMLVPPAPRYPRDTNSLGGVGMCSVRLFIDDAGEVDDYSFEGCHSALREATARSLEAARFKPLMDDEGQGYKSQAVLNVSFVLRDAPSRSSEVVAYADDIASDGGCKARVHHSNTGLVRIAGCGDHPNAAAWAHWWRTTHFDAQSGYFELLLDRPLLEQGPPAYKGEWAPNKRRRGPYPRMPLEAKAMKVQGPCLIDMTLDDKGRVEGWTYAACPELWRASIDASLARSRFERTDGDSSQSRVAIYFVLR